MNLLDFLGEFDGPEPVEQRADVNEIDGDEESVPKRRVQPADNRPGPEHEEDTAYEQRAPQVQHAVQAARGQMR